MLQPLPDSAAPGKPLGQPPSRSALYTLLVLQAPAERVDAATIYTFKHSRCNKVRNPFSNSSQIWKEPMLSVWL